MSLPAMTRPVSARLHKASGSRLRSRLARTSVARDTPPVSCADNDRSTGRPQRRANDLAGETFRDEAELLERRLWAGPVPTSGTNLPDEATAEVATSL